MSTSPIPELIGNGYANETSGDIARYNFFTRGIANQADLDNQLEYRFNTGRFSTRRYSDLDLKHYAISDYAGLRFRHTFDQCRSIPVYTQIAPFSGAPYRNSELTQNQLGTYLQDQIKLGRLTLVLQRP